MPDRAVSVTVPDRVASATAGRVRGLLAAEARQQRLAAAETLDVYRPPAHASDHVRTIDWAEHVREGARLGVLSGRVAQAAWAFSHLDGGRAPAAVRRNPAARAAPRRRAR
ncbi:hypothetical protein [Jidongwangia harbinensis]|uniref:hypothetical protein n=1 Tax=Jidongwangia harbinensis TaxID=2878561 RepID=UPI001CD9BA19|nr:hypothetical protein [Jidongwangia harbinensis]MCA2214326.1 hypothetical protein [Jidongwangia harbinensis]